MIQIIIQLKNLATKFSVVYNIVLFTIKSIFMI